MSVIFLYGAIATLSLMLWYLKLQYREKLEAQQLDAQIMEAIKESNLIERTISERTGRTYRSGEIRQMLEELLEKECDDRNR